MRSGTATRTSKDHDFREFLDEDGQDEDQDGDEVSEDVNFRDFIGRGWPGRGPGRGRGRQFKEIPGTSEDVDVLRRPGSNDIDFIILLY